MAVEWVRTNIAMHKGNPARVFSWSQSAGNQPVANYIGHPELYGPKGVGLKGAVFMSSPGFSILPATPPQVQGGNGGPCNDPATGQPSAGGRGAPGGGGARAGGAARGTGGRGAGGAARGTGGAGRGRGQVDEATLLARSDLPGLVSSKLPFIVSSAELDPPGVIAFAETFRDALTKDGRPPLYLTFKDHSHISEVEAVNTKDVSVTGPILKWIKGVK
jgi:triacylglycerol lipase